MFTRNWVLAATLATILTLAVACSSESPPRTSPAGPTAIARSEPAPTNPAPAAGPASTAPAAQAEPAPTARPRASSAPAEQPEPAPVMPEVEPAAQQPETPAEQPQLQLETQSDQDDATKHAQLAEVTAATDLRATASRPKGDATTDAMPSAAANSSGRSQPQPGATTFRDYQRLPMVAAVEDSVSTFSLDTDRASYRLALNWAREGFQVEPDSVRAEEWINAFNYNYSRPVRDSEFAITTEVFRHPLEGHLHLARLAFQAPNLRDDALTLNVTLVLDASGSMAEGNRVDIARTAAESIRQSLRSQDRIAVVHFSEAVLDHLTVEHRDPDDQDVRWSINRLQPTNATNVQAGLNLGVQLAHQARWERPNAYNYVILMSDGVANVDATNPFAILESTGDYNQENPLRLVTIGVGIQNYNDYLLEQLAQHGNGWYRYLDNTNQAQDIFSRANWLSLAIPFADQTRAQVTWNPELVRSWRIVGYENRVTADELFTQDRKEFAEIPSGAATTVFYELELTNRVPERQVDTAKLGDVELRWVEPTTGNSRQQHAAISGRWRQDFSSLNDPLLQLGTLVALAADRYSSLPYADSPGSPNVGQDLSTLSDQLQPLQRDLEQLTAYSDFKFLLRHISRNIPLEGIEPKPGDSGYSP